MKLFGFSINIFFLVIFICFVFFINGCGMKNVIPENQLQTMPPKKILELGATEYDLNNYKEAIYYYSNIIKMFPENNDANNEARAWARYEIGYIKYQDKKYKEALAFFDEVLKTKSQSNAPQILASEMKDKINSIKKK